MEDNKLKEIQNKVESIMFDNARDSVKEIVDKIIEKEGITIYDKDNTADIPHKSEFFKSLLNRNEGVFIAPIKSIIVNDRNKDYFAICHELGHHFLHSHDKIYTSNAIAEDTNQYLIENKGTNEDRDEIFMFLLGLLDLEARLSNFIKERLEISIKLDSLKKRSDIDEDRLPILHELKQLNDKSLLETEFLKHNFEEISKLSNHTYSVIDTPIEKLQADYFASYMMMPSGLFEKSYRDMIKKMAKKFNVSPAIMEERIENYINELNQYKPQDILKD